MFNYTKVVSGKKYTIMLYPAYSKPPRSFIRDEKNPNVLWLTNVTTIYIEYNDEYHSKVVVNASGQYCNCILLHSIDTYEPLLYAMRWYAYVAKKQICIIEPDDEVRNQLGHLFYCTVKLLPIRGQPLVYSKVSSDGHICGYLIENEAIFAK